jgi:hypothetical protein
MAWAPPKGRQGMLLGQSAHPREGGRHAFPPHRTARHRRRHRRLGRARRCRGRHPTQGVTPTPLGRGTFSERAKVNTSNIKAKIKPSDFVVLSLHFAPGGTTGWHSHSGSAMMIVQEAPLPCTTPATASAAPLRARAGLRGQGQRQCPHRPQRDRPAGAGAGGLCHSHWRRAHDRRARSGS